NYRVVVLSIIGDYSNWKPAMGREKEIVEGTVQIGKEYGVEMRFLDFTEMRFDASEANTRKVAETIGEIEPALAFQLWPHEHHPDHERASQLAKVALRYGDRLLERGRKFKAPQQIYWFDNGPRHTIGFEPNAFVDVTDDWPRAIEWLGRLMALVRNKPYDPQQ